MRVIGLTGGIATGKSTVAEILRQLGAVVLDADQIAREIVAPGQPAWREIVDYFGPEVLRSDGTLDRPVLGQRVFADPVARQKLNAITHPQVRAEFERQLARLRQESLDRVVFLDVPLLIEAGMNDLVDEIWVTAVDEQTQLKRLMERDGLSEAAARQRIASQMPLAEKVKVADRVIDNRGSITDTVSQVRKLWRELGQTEENTPKQDMIDLPKT
ncbi:MAG: dephospho-CoA kinase [Firmicutes bacterium]|nr:dephospho-CoA kinase [Bacillota bacterium]